MRDGPVCGNVGPTNLLCAKRPHQQGHHVAFDDAGGAVWWDAGGVRVQGEHTHATSPHNAAQRTHARASGYTGDVCAICGSIRMVRSGTCQTCHGCGATSGCS